MTPVNNEFYGGLGDDWWDARDHMIALLREEANIKLDYLRARVAQIKGCQVLDLGAGAGLVSLPLAAAGGQVTAADISDDSLAVLRRRGGNSLGIVTAVWDAMVPNPSWQESFDVVVAYDVLEHVTHPHQLIAAAASYLRPGGKLFLHTLNRTWHCRLLYLGIVPSLIRRSPEGLHRHEYNIRPQELTGWVGANRLQLAESPIGIRVPLLQRGVWEMLTRRRLDSPLRFEYTSDLSLGYLVHALR